MTVRGYPVTPKSRDQASGKLVSDHWEILQINCNICDHFTLTYRNWKHVTTGAHILTAHSLYKYQFMCGNTSSPWSLSSVLTIVLLKHIVGLRVCVFYNLSVCQKYREDGQDMNVLRCTPIEAALLHFSVGSTRAGSGKVESGALAGLNPPLNARGRSRNPKAWSISSSNPTWTSQVREKCWKRQNSLALYLRSL